MTNTSLYCIGASLKTALHTFNVVVTLLVSAMLGLDEEFAVVWVTLVCVGGQRALQDVGGARGQRADVRSAWISAEHVRAQGSDADHTFPPGASGSEVCLDALSWRALCFQS